MTSNSNRQDLDPRESFTIPQTSCIHDICPCSLCHRCDIWTEYQIACDALSDAAELSHENMIEIEYLQERIDFLERYLDSLETGNAPKRPSD